MTARRQPGTPKRGTPQRQINRLREALAVAIDCMRTTEDTGDDGASDRCIRDCLRVLRETKP